jgi:hypothetical protein
MDTQKKRSRRKRSKRSVTYINKNLSTEVKFYDGAVTFNVTSKQHFVWPTTSSVPIFAVSPGYWANQRVGNKIRLLSTHWIISVSNTDLDPVATVPSMWTCRAAVWLAREQSAVGIPYGNLYFVSPLAPTTYQGRVYDVLGFRNQNYIDNYKCLSYRDWQVAGSLNHTGSQYNMFFPEAQNLQKIDYRFPGGLEVKYPYPTGGPPYDEPVFNGLAYSMSVASSNTNTDVYNTVQLRVMLKFIHYYTDV